MPQGGLKIDADRDPDSGPPQIPPPLPLGYIVDYYRSNMHGVVLRCLNKFQITV